jgi:hypothetical protein
LNILRDLLKTLDRFALEYFKGVAQKNAKTEISKRKQTHYPTLLSLMFFRFALFVFLNFERDRFAPELQKRFAILLKHNLPKTGEAIPKTGWSANLSRFNWFWNQIELLCCRLFI